MGLITSLARKLVKLILYLAVFAGLILLIPNLPPYTQFTKIEVEPTLPRSGALAPNDALNNPEKLYVGKILGPEAFELHNGEVYTGLATGEIVKLSPAGHVTFVTKLGKPCAGLHQEHVCGRPLGLEIDKKNNQLYVADAYHGIWKVDLKTNKKQLLVSPNVEINGKKPKLINDLALDTNGDFFWTDSNSDFSLKDGSYALNMDPSGRLFHYNAAKNVSTVLADKLGFSNGVAISPDRQFVLVSESNMYRVTKVYTSGPKKGKSEVFVAGLPGTPDNMRALPDGSGVLLALYTVFDAEHPLLTRSLQPLPLARKLLVRTALMVENVFDFLNTQVPHPIFENIVYNLGHFKSVSGLLSGSSGLVQLDWSGNIVASYFSTDGRTPTISDAIVVDGRLWTGAAHEQDYVAIFPAPPLLKRAFAARPEEKAEIKQKIEPPKANPPPPKPQKVDSKKEQPTQPPAQQKPAAAAKPAENKQPEKKPQQTTPPPVQKPAPARPVETKQPEKKPAPQTTPPPATQKPVQQKSPEKQAEKKPVAAPQQPAGAQAKPNKDTKPTQRAVPENTKPAEKAKTQSKDQQKTTPPPEPKQPPRSADKQIPVREEIPADTAKPSSGKLKVIKKSGPDVIPNPAV